MKQTYTSLATKIKNDVVMNELLIASYGFGSEFEKIFTSRAFCDALNFMSLYKKF